MKKFSQFLIALSATIAFAVNTNAQEIHIKARFVEVPKETFESMQKNFDLASDGTALLTPEQALSALKSFHSDSGVKPLAEPEATTRNRMQVQMRATAIQSVITNFAFWETATNSGILPQTGIMETGPILDVVATVSSGNQILLKTTAKVMAFLGYADPKNATKRFVTNSAGQKITLPIVLPQFETKQASAKITVSDGQTVLLFEKSSNAKNQSPDEKLLRVNNPGIQQKFLVVMITPTIVAPADKAVFRVVVPPK